MKKKQLEMFLQQTPDFPFAKPSLEQYQTPATIAADVLFYAYQQHDIFGKKVVDLGCGTGIFSFGAAVLKAKEIIGVDKDAESIAIAKDFAEKNQLPILFLTQDVLTFDFSSDTVIMNPPFGAQKGNLHADKDFLKKAIENAAVIYSFHLNKTIPHLKTYIRSLHAEIDTELTVSFPLKAQFTFHKKLMDQVQVSCLRIVH